MARRIDQLTDRGVQAKKAKGLYADGGGLYLQVSASGSKSWIFRYKVGGRARDMGLGSVRVVSLAEARNLAAGARRLRKEGLDPIEDRKTQAAQKRLAETRAKTFREAAAEYIAAHEAGWKNLKHREQWKRTLAAYAHPIIGDLPVADIGTQDVRAVLEPIWVAKPETAARVRGRIEAIINAARADDDSRWSNPARWERHKHKFLKRSSIAPTRHHPALEYKRLPAFMATLRSRSGTTDRALEFLTLTATRTVEVRGARWDEFDRASRIWVIPADRMKARKEHRVPLCNRAVAILKEMAAVRASDLVFPGVKSSSEPLHERTLLMALSELYEGITVHGFRSSFRDWAGEETDYPHDICEAALAHTRKDKTHAAYQRGDLLRKRRELMEAWGRYSEGPRKRQGRRTSPRQATGKARKILVRAGLPIRQPIQRARPGSL